jgi:hypothetical protein
MRGLFFSTRLSLVAIFEVDASFLAQYISILVYYSTTDYTLQGMKVKLS